MDSVCVITDQKKRLRGQTMELEKLRKEENGELEYSEIIFLVACQCCLFVYIFIGLSANRFML